MKAIEFKQTNRFKLKLFATVYFTLLLAFTIYAIFGTIAIVDFINSFRFGKFVGILGGLLFLSPLMLLSRLTTHKLSLTFDDEKVRVQEKSKEFFICYSDINEMNLNRHRLNELELFNRQQVLLFTFRSASNGNVLEELISFFTQKIAFQKTVKQRKVVGGYINSVSFKRHR